MLEVEFICRIKHSLEKQAILTFHTKHLASKIFAEEKLVKRNTNKIHLWKSLNISILTS